MGAAAARRKKTRGRKKTAGCAFGLSHTLAAPIVQSMSRFSETSARPENKKIKDSMTFRAGRIRHVSWLAAGPP
jgi:hypothetical protein